MSPDQQQGETERSVDVLRTMQRSHNSARLTAEEYPRSEVLADHSADTKLAMDAVAEYVAANDEYDAAFAAQYPKQTIIARRLAAIDRRALAHAKMKGR